MKSIKAFVNSALYLGGGEYLSRGFVVSSGATIQGVGAMADFHRLPRMEVFDVSGGLILPGLTDCHLHLVGYGLSLAGLDLSHTQSLEEGLQMVRRHLEQLPRGAWLKGRGWDKQRWGLPGFPSKEALDRIAPDNLVALTSRDGHLMWVNSLVIDSLGLAERAGSVEGGEIEVDREGRPTGILKENAIRLVSKKADRESGQHVVDAVEHAARRLINLGFTCVHSVEGARDALAVDAAQAQGKIALDLVRLREINHVDDLDGLKPSPQATFIKIYGDGALGSQTASMLEPYGGQAGNLGIIVTPKEQLGEMVFRSIRKGFSLAIHAIGDRANMEVLDVFEDVRAKSGGESVILRIEHAQVLRNEDIPRFGRLGVIASMQPIHLVSDREVSERYWGARCKNAYAFKSILEAGGTLAFGSDAPIEDPDPLRAIHAAVTRLDPASPSLAPWHSDQRLTLAQAIDGYTAGAALAGGRQRVAGAIRPAMRCDLTILDHDVWASPDPAVILKTRVAMTVIGGEVHVSS